MTICFYIFHSKSTTKFFKFNQAGIIQIIPLLLLLGGIIAGVWLVQHKTNLLPKAQEANYIQIVDKNGNPITETEDPNVYLKITLPPGWELPKEQTSGLIPPLVKEAYAQESCPQSGRGTTTTFGTTTYDKCVDDKGGVNDKDNYTLCKTGGTKFRCFWSGSEDCISGENKNDFNFSCPTTNSTTVNSNSGSTDEQTVMDYVNCRRCSADGSSCGSEGSDFGPNSGNGEWCACARKYSADFSTNPAFQVCQKSESTPQPESKSIKLISLEIWNGELSSTPEQLGNDRLKVKDNFEQYLNKPIPWRIHSNGKLVIINDGVRKVYVEFRGYRQGITYEARVVLKDPQPFEPPIPTYTVKSPWSVENIQTFPVEVYLAKDNAEYSQIKDKIEGIINSYLNSKLTSPPTNKRVRLSQVNDIPTHDCISSFEKYGPWNGKIRMYIGGNRQGGRHGWAMPWVGVICSQNSSLMYNGLQDTLLHELGHIFGLPDYYLEEVKHSRNNVTRIGISPKIRDVMTLRGDFYDSISAELVNRTRNLPLSDPWTYQRLFTPQQIKVQIVDDSGAPIKDVKLEVFPSVAKKGYDDTYSIFIPDTLSWEDKTNSAGEIVLGGAANIFVHRNISSIYPTVSALLKFTYNNEVRYAALTQSDLLIRYFGNDDQESTTFKYKFSSLIKSPAGAGGRILTIGGEFSPAEEEGLEKHLQDHLMIEELTKH